MERKWKKRYNAGFVSIIGLLLTLVIILILCFIAFKVYFQMPEPDEETMKDLSRTGIDTSSYQAIMNSTREKVKDFNKQLRQHTKQLEDFR